MKPIVIAGAGITGCVIALELARKGYKVILIEKDRAVGGLAKTFHYEDFAFDIGPHRFYSQKEEISNFIRDILGNDYIVLSRHSEVYFYGKYYSWPLRPAVVFKLPLRITLKSGWDLVYLCIKNRIKEINTFEDYILTNYGPSLYNVFFRDYTRKFLGRDPTEVHFEWAKEGMKRTIIDESIASRNLVDIFKLFFMFKPPKTEFIYPIRGTGVFCNRLIEEFKAHGGDVRTGAVITGMKCNCETIEKVSLDGAAITPRSVVWTGPLGDICGLLNLSSEGVEYLSLVLFNIELNKPPNKAYQWCYYGSKDIIFSRVTMPSLFSKEMSPLDRSSLCVEVACMQGDELWNNPDILFARVKTDLLKVGLVSRPQDIGRIHIEKVSNAYPIYARDYPLALKKIKVNLGKFRNLALAGRTGLFWYNNMDNSIENGLEVARGIIQGP